MTGQAITKSAALKATGLQRWLEDQAGRAPGAQWVELRHIEVNGQLSPVQRWLVSDETDETVSEMWASAQQWADAVGSGPQRFCLAVLDTGDRTLAQFMLRVGSDAVGGTAWDSEPPTLEGVTKQLMRHNEAHAKLSAASVQSVIDRLVHENDRLSCRIQEYETKHVEMLQLYETLVSKQHERELDVERQRRHDTRRDTLVEKLAVLVPLAAAKLIGKGQLAPDPVMKSLAQSLEGDQVQQIASVLKPEQLAALANLLERHAEPDDDRPAPEPEVARA